MLLDFCAALDCGVALLAERYLMILKQSYRHISARPRAWGQIVSLFADFSGERKSYFTSLFYFEFVFYDV